MVLNRINSLPTKKNKMNFFDKILHKAVDWEVMGRKVMFCGLCDEVIKLIMKGNAFGWKTAVD